MQNIRTDCRRNSNEGSFETPLSRLVLLVVLPEDEMVILMRCYVTSQRNRQYENAIMYMRGRDID